MVSGVGGPPGGGGKIGGPGAPSPAIPKDAIDATKPTAGAKFGEALSRTEASGATSAATPLERLRSGEIDAKQYVELRVSEATAHLEGVLPPGDLDKIREDLHDLIEHDPDVAALVKSAEIGR